MTFKRGHALVIGVGTYPKAPLLNNAAITANDAEEVARMLRDAGYCGYPGDQVQLLHNGEATRDRILAEMNALKSVAVEDTVFIFYSGHGEFGEDGAYYLTTNDTRLNAQRKVVKDGGVRERELLEALKEIKAQRALLIFNACHAGAIAPDALGAERPAEEPEITGQNLPDEVASAILGTGQGRVIITACRKDQKSYYSSKEPTTLFAQALTDGLRGKDVRPRSGYIGIFDLYDYVHDRVNRTAARRWEKVQEPEITVSRGVGVMAVALYRGETPQAELGPEDRPSKLSLPPREVDPEVSAKALTQILSGKYNFASGDSISHVEIVEGHKLEVNVPGDKGFIYIPRGLLYQGSDQRRGIFGGTFHGSAVGNNEGTILQGGMGTANIQPSPLEEALRHVQQVVEQARHQNLANLAGDLQGVELFLNQAVQAEGQRDADRRQKKLQQAKDEVERLAAQETGLRPLLTIVQRVT